MKKEIFLFVLMALSLFLLLSLFDYIGSDKINWITNILQSLFIIAFVRMIYWLSNRNKKSPPSK